MQKTAAAYLERWVRAGLIDDEAAARIRAFEASEAPPAQTRWAAGIAWGFGALLIGAGIVSFVASNWEGMTPATRMALILMLTAGFHVAAGFAGSVPALRMALHGIGTACLGAGIALAGQVFQLDSDWNGWMLLWAIGSAIGYGLIRDGLQLVLAALLLPLWISSEWNVRGPHGHDALPVLCFWLGLGLLYFLSSHRPLRWLGGIGLIPLTITVLVLGGNHSMFNRLTPVEAYWAFAVVVVVLALVGWLTFGGFDIRGFSAISAVVLISFGATEVGGWMLHFVLGVSFVALCAWGVAEHREGFVNVGIAGFAMTVFGFYVSHALTLLGSSIGLILLGILMLGGGFALERTRRRLLGKIT